MDHCTSATTRNLGRCQAAGWYDTGPHSISRQAAVINGKEESQEEMNLGALIENMVIQGRLGWAGTVGCKDSGRFA